MKRTVYALGVSVLALALSGCWEQPRFDAGRSNWNSGESTITASNVTNVVEKWSTDTGDAPVKAPVSRSGAIFAAAAEFEQPGYAVALDAATGEESWTTQLTQAGQAATLYDPAYKDGELLVPTGAGASFGGVFRLDPRTGQSLGQISGNHVISIAVADGDLATLAGFGNISFRGATLSWRYAARVAGAHGGPLPGFDFAFVGDRMMWSLGSQAHGYSETCPRIEPGSTICSAPDWTHDLGGTPVGVANAGGGNVVYPDSSGRVTVLDATNGEPVWTAELGAAAVGFPAVADGTILVGTADNRLVALSAADGTPLWSANLAGIPGAPVVGGNVVYVPVDSSIQAFGLDGCGAGTCPALKTLTTSSPISGGPVVDDGRIVVGQNDGTITAFGLP